MDKYKDSLTINSFEGLSMIRFSLMLISLVIVSGCASITRGTSEAYAIESEPVGATANLSNGLSCQTPCSLKVKRRSDFTVTFEKEGYEDITATVTSSVDGGGAAGMAETYSWEESSELALTPVRERCIRTSRILL